MAAYYHAQWRLIVLPKLTLCDFDCIARRLRLAAAHCVKVMAASVEFVAYPPLIMIRVAANVLRSDASTDDPDAHFVGLLESLTDKFNPISRSRRASPKVAGRLLGDASALCRLRMITVAHSCTVPRTALAAAKAPRGVKRCVSEDQGHCLPAPWTSQAS